MWSSIMYYYMKENPLKKLDFKPPSTWKILETIDMHTLGEPLRIIMSGFPHIEGNSVLEKRRFFKSNLDDYRKSLMWEPRGHNDMYGAIITEPTQNNTDFGVFFIHNDGYSTMCGHAIIALTTFMYETGIFNTDTHKTLKIEAPSGIISSKPLFKKNNLVAASFINVPSFVLHSDVEIKIDGINVLLDIAFGGAFYIIIKASYFDLEIIEPNIRKFIDLNRKLCEAINSKLTIDHPFDDDLSFLYGTIFTSRPKNSKNHSKNICVFANGEVDRSPTGSGISARAALLYHQNKLNIHQKITIESIIDTCMDVEIKKLTSFAKHQAVITEITGSAWFTGRNEFWIDPKDPLKNGFLIR